MKRAAFITAVFLGAIILTWAGRPLAAQGIASDEIWQLADSLLHERGSPHLNIDFNEVMGRMSIVSDDEGNLYLMTNIVVYPHEVDAYATAVEEALAAAHRFALASGRSGMVAFAEYEIVEVDNDSVEILLYEALGAGGGRTVGDKGSGR
jgi:hypothetical protein